MYSDGSHTVFLSTVGTNEEEVPKALVNFLKFVAADINECEKDYNDEYVRRLQDSVRKIKASRDMEGRYMLFEEMMKNEYKSGHEDGVAEGLVKGKIASLMLLLESGHTISDSLSEKIGQVNDEEKLDELLMVAVTAASVEEFEEKLDEILAGQVKSTKIN